MGDITIFKISAGIDVICEVLNREDGIVTIKTPIALVPNPQDGKIAAIPWIQIGDNKKVKLNYDHVVAEIEPDAEIKNFYNEKFGSGLTIVSSMPTNVQDIKPE